ncbi:phage tail protein [Bartonella sp. F02]|uniref:phage tail protein n=1 Tax=Bartonella sp. F02 TaxID=2967262 RepID=UPI0022A96003|nr:phage tail protein [Bartonella sp. F02]MCZ2328880.1 tail fiber protein [Bartonella sp. F02]
MSSIYDWSLTAPENARSDDIINWAEGQPPSSVNDSARAMMQRLREYISDRGGAIETKFIVNSDENKTSIALTTKSPIAKYTNDIVIRFRAQNENVGTTSVTLNNLAAQSVYKLTQKGIELLTGGEFKKGGIYELIYHCDIAGKNLGGWYLTSSSTSFFGGCPPGFIATFAMQNLPEGWILCDGKEHSRTEYSNLFAAIGETWGKGNGTTTFNVPDLRGMFLRGLDNERGIDKNRVLGSKQEECFKAHTHTGKTDEAGEHRHEYTKLTKIRPGDSNQAGTRPRFSSPSVDDTTEEAGRHNHTITLDETGGEETRPVNVAVVYAIKT